MPLVFRDYQVLVISPGSVTTQVQSGIPESLLPAQYELPTVVYADGDKFSTTGDESAKISPLKGGAIDNQDAFHYFLKVAYRNAMVKDAPPPALLLVGSLAWNRRQTEQLCRYLFEEVGVPALSLVSQGLAVAYAYAAADCLVVDVGYEKTELTFVNDFEINNQASRVVPLGGQSITENLHKHLPNLTADQIEDLKLSHIAEVLSEEDRARAPGDAPEGVVGEEEEGVVDVAAIVSSGRTREILEERERQKKGSEEGADAVLNKDMATNTFTDRNGNEITVGSERFRGSEELIDSIVTAIGEGFLRVTPKAQHHIWDNVCVTGRGAQLHGFRSEVIDKLEARYLLSRPSAFDQTNAPSGTASALNAATPAPSEPPNSSLPRQTPAETDFPVQTPGSIKLSKLSDHFPEWKNSGWETASFLGALISAKQIFTAGLDGVFISRQDYNEMGPYAVWDMV